MLKSELRKEYKEKRSALTDSQRYSFDLSISEGIKSFLLQNDLKKVHVFLPIEKWKEFNSFQVLNDKELSRVSFCVPVVDGEEMKAVAYNLESLTISKWGIPEPKGDYISDVSDLELILVPLLVCDYRGSRVGYGKGFYDRFLKSLPVSVKKIGVSYFPLLTNEIDTDDWDIPLNGVFTPEGFIEF